MSSSDEQWERDQRENARCNGNGSVIREIKRDGIVRINNAATLLFQY